MVAGGAAEDGGAIDHNVERGIASAIVVAGQAVGGGVIGAGADGKRIVAAAAIKNRAEAGGGRDIERIVGIIRGVVAKVERAKIDSGVAEAGAAGHGDGRSIDGEGFGGAGAFDDESVIARSAIDEQSSGGQRVAVGKVDGEGIGGCAAAEGKIFDGGFGYIDIRRIDVGIVIFPDAHVIAAGAVEAD